MKCRIKEIAHRFLSMSPSDMEFVYSMIKDTPFVQQGYELAKQTIKERQEKCTSNRNGAQ